MNMGKTFNECLNGMYGNYLRLNEIVFNEISVRSILDEVEFLKNDMNDIFLVVIENLEYLESSDDDIDVQILLNVCGYFQRYRVHADQSIISRYERLYLRFLEKRFHEYCPRFEDMVNKKNKLGKLIFISGLPRAGNSIFANIGSDDFQVFDEPASWEMGGFKEHNLDALLSGKNICIIRPNFNYVMPAVVAFMRDVLRVDVAGLYLERNIADVSKSYLKRSMIARKTKVNWKVSWDDNYALYEFTDHRRILYEQRVFFQKKVGYESLRSNAEEWRKTVSYLYSLAGLVADDKMIRSAFDFNAKFTTDTPASHLKLLESH